MSRNRLKMLAVLAMLADHAAVVYLPSGSAAYFVCRLIGRITAPVMCFFLAEGYYYTHSLQAYLKRLLFFALLSQPVWSLALYGKLRPVPWNMMGTLLLGLLALAIQMNDPSLPFAAGLTPRMRICLIMLLIGLSGLGDWGGMAPAWVLLFGIFRDDRKKVLRILAASALIMTGLDALALAMSGKLWYGELWDLGILLAIPLLAGYRGRRGSSHPFYKWFFYWFYPLHLLVPGICRGLQSMI